MLLKVLFLCWAFHYIIGFLVALITNGQIKPIFHYAILITEFLLTTIIVGSIIQQSPKRPVGFRSGLIINSAQIFIVLIFSFTLSHFTKSSMLSTLWRNHLNFGFLKPHVRGFFISITQCLQLSHLFFKFSDQ